MIIKFEDKESTHFLQKNNTTPLGLGTNQTTAGVRDSLVLGDGHDGDAHHFAHATLKDFVTGRNNVTFVLHMQNKSLISEHNIAIEAQTPLKSDCCRITRYIL